MANLKKTELYVCGGDSLGDRANLHPARHTVDDTTLFHIREALKPHIMQWSEGVPHADLNDLLASVYLQGALDGNLLRKRKAVARS